MLTKEEREAGRVFREAKARERRASKAARPKSPKADRGRVRDPGFLAFLRRQPCAVGPVGCRGPVQAAHIRTSLPGEPPTGLQRKPNDDRCCPLCAGHHEEQHSMNEMRFWAKHGKDPFAVAFGYFKAYQRGEL